MAHYESDAGSKQVADLGVTVVRTLLERELEAAKRKREQMQKTTAIITDTVLTLKRHSNFYPAWKIRLALKFTEFYYAIQLHSRISTEMLKDYDRYSEDYAVLDAMVGRLQTPLNVEELRGLVSAEQASQVALQLRPTLEELTSVYKMTLQAIDNSRKLIIEAWQYCYPKRPFPREQPKSSIG